MIIRTWKRDGTTNVMSLDVAVANLEDNVIDESTKLPIEQRVQQIREALEGGLTLETPLALFCRSQSWRPY
jgi:hypothetical protein